MKLYTPAFAALFLANLTLVSSFSSFFLFPLYITDFGGDDRDIGIIMGAFAMASAFSRPWIANMIDRIGRKRSYTIGTFIMVTMPLIHLLLMGPIAENYLILLLARIIHGIGLAICFTAIFTFIIDLIPIARLNEGIGIFGTSGLVGMAIGPMVTEPILRNFGYPAFFITAALFSTMALLLHLPVHDPYRENKRRQSSQSSDTEPSFFALLKTRKHLVCGSLALIFGVGLAASSNFIAPLAQSRSLSYVSLYYLAYSVAAILVRVIGGKLGDRIGEKQILPWGLLLGAFALLLCPLINNNALLLVVGFIFGTGHGLLFPALNTMAIRGEPYHVRGKVTGIFTGGIDSGSFLGAMILGVIAHSAGYNILFICAGLTLACGLLIFRLRPR